MEGFGWPMIGLFAAIAPLGVARGFAALAAGRFWRVLVLALAAAAAGFLLVAIGVLAGQRVLDWLNLTPPRFQLAAGCMMLPVALRLLWSGESMSLPARASLAPPSAYFLLAPLLTGPAPFVAALYYGARYGTGASLTGAAIALVFAALLLTLGPWLLRRAGDTGVAWLGRCSGAFLIVVAVKLIVDGVNSR